MRWLTHSSRAGSWTNSRWAAEQLAQMGYREVKKVVDQQAAVLILESFLDQPEERRLRA